MIGPVPNFNPTGSPYAGTGAVGSGTLPPGGVDPSADVVLLQQLQQQQHGSMMGGANIPYQGGVVNPGTVGAFGRHQASGGFAAFHQQQHNMPPHPVNLAAVAAAAAAAVDSSNSILQWRHVLRLNGFSEQAAVEIIGALHTLLQHGLVSPVMSSNRSSFINFGGGGSGWMLNWPIGVTVRVSVL